MTKKMIQSCLLTLVLVLFMFSGAMADKVTYLDYKSNARALRTSGINRTKAHQNHSMAHHISPIYYPASFTVYTDRSLFQAAFPSFSLETFESSPLIGNISSGAVASQTFKYFSVSSVPPAIKVLGAPGGEGSFNTTPGGSKYLYLDTDRFLVGSQTTFSLEAPTLAFGFDYTGVNQIGNIFSATILNQTYQIASNPDNSTSSFWGIITKLPFSAAILTTSTDSGYGIDQVTLGNTSVPEPSTMLLLGSGLLGLIGFRRRFKK